MKRLALSSIIIFFLMAFSCSTNNDSSVVTPTLSSTFDPNPLISPIIPGQIDEASGLCDSRSMSGNLWVEQDSFNPNEIYLLSHTGKVMGSVKMPFPNRDWEDITIGAGPVANKNYIYLAEIGDNAAIYDISMIYRFVEPSSLSESVTTYDQLAFQYPDGSHDAECILLDPATKDIYIVTKRESKVRLYQLPYPQSTTTVMTAKFISELPFTYITSGGISPDGKEIVIKSYSQIYYWQRKTDESIITALSRAYDKTLPYVIEPQGEGFCFDKESKGYYTCSEIYNSPSTNLYYFARK